jgi:hypothetical protein
MSNIFTKFWPFKSFLTYVFKRYLGKYLKNNIDLKLYNFSGKKVTFKDLELNTQVHFTLAHTKLLNINERIGY